MGQPAPARFSVPEQAIASLAAQASANAVANARGAQDNARLAAGSPAATRPPSPPAALHPTPAGQTESTAQSSTRTSGAGFSAPPALADGEALAPSTAAVGALAAYDRAWSGYVSALRHTATASVGRALPAERTEAALDARVPVGLLAGDRLLSGEGQLTLARAWYLQQRLTWQQWEQAFAGALATRGPDAAEPEHAKAVRAELRLRQAAEVVALAQAAGAPLLPAQAAQVDRLLDDAERFHREWLAGWAGLLANRSAV
jgi:hypothetical protein